MDSAKFFTEFESYCDSIAHADVHMRVLGMEEPRYSMVQNVAGQLGLQWAQEGSGQLSEGGTDPGAFGLYMPLNRRPRLLNGLSLSPDAIVVLHPGPSSVSPATMPIAGLRLEFQPNCLTLPRELQSTNCMIQ
ncbi:hypothetical protein KOR42_48450 [Thalassoglobus neptunius]|uniref:Uncharacterized protein n=1 Tax=Thalassoglobus neptunius TaxID=1938619 RepID=A0A5C5VTS2_9PLAN|nr:hypothetical protein KOR42_48450 [Thalassoglobus neptunius]